MPPQSREDVLASALAEACEALEKNARDAFVVDGIPATQEGFEAAWDDEDGPSYAQWLRLRALVAPPARRSISMGRVG